MDPAPTETTPTGAVARTRLLVVDDHEVVRAGLAAALAQDPLLEVAGAAGSGREAMALLPGLRPDVAVVDMRLPDMSGDELCRRLRERTPGLAVVVLSSYLTEQAVREAVEAGATGYVTKAAGLGELRAAIAEAAAGTGRRASVSQIMRRLEEVVDGRDGVGVPTPQQARVLALAAEGLTYPEMARRLSISESTVRFHIQKMKLKLGARSRTDLVVRAVRAGLVVTPDEEDS
ncbi:response regulator transcription factor [Pseudonocardia alni]|uniref:response regulator transcription factor n=1 Tax=Pseudonocardia alni TaxID=33907 RepID=UPI00333236A1